MYYFSVDSGSSLAFIYSYCVSSSSFRHPTWLYTISSIKIPRRRPLILPECGIPRLDAGARCEASCSSVRIEFARRGGSTAVAVELLAADFRGHYTAQFLFSRLNLFYIQFRRPIYASCWNSNFDRAREVASSASAFRRHRRGRTSPAPRKGSPRRAITR